MTDVPSPDEFVKLTFTGEFEDQSPIKGRVLEVDTTPDIYATELVFVVHDASGERDVVYGEGKLDGEPWANVTLRNKNTKLGENATWKILE